MRGPPHPPLDFSARYDAPELLDSGAGTLADVAANLEEIARINRSLGGFRALTRHLYPLLAAADHSITLIDLGTGGGHLLDEIGGWARRKGIDVRLSGIDWSARNLVVAHRRSRHLSLARADARCLPVCKGDCDFFISTLFLHHLKPAEVVQVLHSAYTVSRRGIVMSDLVRGWLPYLAYKLVSPVFARHPFTRLDGALSVRRAYSPVELLELSHWAGLIGAQIYTHWPWRMTLVALKDPTAQRSEKVL